MLITIDFDGTCVTNSFPFLGKDIGAAPVLRLLVKSGHKLILNTMRNDDLGMGNILSDAVGWFSKNDIPLYAVNANHFSSRFANVKNKVHGDLNIDDHNICTPLFRSGNYGYFIDWVEIHNFLVIHDIYRNVSVSESQSAIVEIKKERDLL